MPAEVEVGVSALVNRDCQGERLRPELVFTDRAPEVMVRPVPVMSVMAASAETFRESVTVVEALSEPEMRRLASMVEDAWTKMPAVVEVGVRALVNAVSQAPLLPAEAQAVAVPETSPLVSTFRHWVEPVMWFKVKPPVIVVAPLSLVVPKTPSVVEGASVPTPTRLVSAWTTRVPPSTVRLPVVVAWLPMSRSPAVRLKPAGLVVPMTRDAEVVAAPLTRSVESKVLDA